MPEAIFVDTWGWIALGHRRDSRHQKVKNFYRDAHKEGLRVYTSDYVLDEVATLIFRRESFEEAGRFMGGILASAQQGYLTIVRRGKEERKIFHSVTASRSSFLTWPCMCVQSVDKSLCLCHWSEL